MKHHHFNILNRREFLSLAGKAGLAAALASVCNVPGFLKRAMAEGTIGSGKKVLFIWLRGANDSLNSVVPIQDTAYATSRPNIRIPTDPGTNYATAGACDSPLAGAASTYGFYPFGVRLGNGFAALHPSLKFLAPVYNAGDLALVHRVGYPKQSRSHFDSQNYWENGNPNNNLSKDGIFYRTIIESGLAGQGVTGVSIQSSLPLILRGSAAALTNLTDPERYDVFGVPSVSSPGSNTKATNAITQANSYTFTAKQNRELLYNQYQSLSATLQEFGAINFSEAGNSYQDDIKTDDDNTWVPINGTSQSIGDPAKGYFLFPTSNDKNGGWRRPDASANGNKYVLLQPQGRRARAEPHLGDHRRHRDRRLRHASKPGHRRQLRGRCARQPPARHRLGHVRSAQIFYEPRQPGELGQHGRGHALRVWPHLAREQ
jgi:hypothetical protein